MDDATRTRDEVRQALAAIARGLSAGLVGRDAVVDGARAARARAHAWLAGFVSGLEHARAADEVLMGRCTPPATLLDEHGRAGWLAGLQGNLAHAEAALNELHISGNWLAGASRGEAMRQQDERPPPALRT